MMSNPSRLSQLWYLETGLWTGLCGLVNYGRDFGLAGLLLSRHHLLEKNGWADPIDFPTTTATTTL